MFKFGGGIGMIIMIAGTSETAYGVFLEGHFLQGLTLAGAAISIAVNLYYFWGGYAKGGDSHK